MSNREKILAEGLGLASASCYLTLSRGEVAKAAGVSPTLIPYFFGGMCAFRSELLREAVRVECLPVLAQAIALRCELEMPEALRQRAIGALYARP